MCGEGEPVFFAFFGVVFWGYDGGGLGGEGGGRISHSVKNNKMINTVSRLFVPCMDPVP